MKPLILITPSLIENEKFLRLSRAYTEGVERAGGIAIIPEYSNLDNIPRFMEIIDGVLLSGGCDITPKYFDESPLREMAEACPIRDEYEIELIRRAAERNMPIFGICRGAQLMNVAFGGKIFQDIHAQNGKGIMKHSQEMVRWNASHAVAVKEDSILGRIAGSDMLEVNSFHHQAVSVVAEGFRVTATAVDGIIEAIEHTELDFCLGVQWHPEHMIDKSTVQLDIFKEFVKVATH